jgi:DNA-binding TFAR19-related protein (PDSD5 family)
VPLDREQLREASAAELRAAGDMSAAALVHSPLAPGATQRFEAVLLSVPEAAGRFELAAEAPGGGSS